MKNKKFLPLLILSIVLTGCGPLDTSSDSNSSLPSNSSEPSGSSEKSKYVITWKNHDGTVLEIDDDVVENTMPVFDGSTPVRSGTEDYSYKFIGWTPSVVVATSNAIYTATFEQTFTIVWKNHDGVVLETDNDVAYGATPMYDGDTPLKDNSAQYTYIFNGWSPELKKVTINETYTATFSRSVNTYNVTWKNYDGKVLKVDYNIAFGTTPVYSGEPPVREPDFDRVYTFDKWSPDVVVVTEDVTYTATFTETMHRPVRFTADHLTFTPTPLTVVDDEWVTIPGMADSKIYWRNVDWTLRGDALLQALKTEMRRTFKQVTYSGALDAAKEMDRDPAKSTNILSLYDLKSQPAAGYNGGKWNREHTFPQSKLYDETGKVNVRANANEKNIASDVANIFACDASLNESRSNNSYGGNWNYDEDPDIYYKRLQENTDKELTDNILYYGLYSPSPIVRGEVARAQLYMLVNWAGHVTRDSNFAIEEMLQWDMEHAPIAERDGQRQTGIKKYQDIRNPFIDNRKLGCYIWSDANTRTRRVCEGIV